MPVAYSRKKHEASSGHLRKLLALEATVTDLENKLKEKDKVLQEVIAHSYRVTPMNIKAKPLAISEKISVIIPVKNGGEQLKGLLSKIRAQKKVRDIEIIVIDSESTDNSVEIAMEYEAKIVNIPQKEFNHGATRNLGAKEAEGDYLVFTVQDAMPVSDYWLYNMICPFIEYPELSALSSKQFVKPEADLFSLWMNKTLTKMLALESDSIYSLSEGPSMIDWKSFDSVTKRRLTFFDNVSSCVRKSVFKEMQFSPLINAEDIDYGVRLLEAKKVLGYLASTGVYHWHERGADYFFKRHYIGTKANVYILKNDLPYFFTKNKIDLECLLANILGMYNLIQISIGEIKDIDHDPIRTVRGFLQALQRNMDFSPGKIRKEFKERETCDDSLDLLLRHIREDTSSTVEDQHNFRQNFLIPVFMKNVGNFTEYLYSKHYDLKGREKDFISCFYKIFAMIAGKSLGVYYLEAETLNRLTPQLKRIEWLLRKGVCYF